MAELLLKIGDGSGFEDGDVLCAFNRRRTRCVHAQHICHVKSVGFNRDGCRPVDSLPFAFMERTHQFKFERVNSTQVVRTNLTTFSQDVLGPVANSEGERINVPEFIARRLQHANHAVFGTQGNEIWFGGNKDFSNPKLDLVWDAIQTRSAKRESDPEFQFWPMGRLDIRTHLAIRVDEFDDTEAEEFVKPMFERTPGGQDRLDQHGHRIMARQRTHHVNWRQLANGLGVSNAQIQDPDFPVGLDVPLGGGRFRHESKQQPHAPRAHFGRRPQVVRGGN